MEVRPSCSEVTCSCSFSGRIRRYRLQLLPLHDMDGSDDDSDEEEEEREGEDREEREPVFTVSKLSTSLIPRPSHMEAKSEGGGGLVLE